MIYLYTTTKPEEEELCGFYHLTTKFNIRKDAQIEIND